MLSISTLLCLYVFLQISLFLYNFSQLYLKICLYLLSEYINTSFSLSHSLFFFFCHVCKRSGLCRSINLYIFLCVSVGVCVLLYVCVYVFVCLCFLCVWVYVCVCVSLCVSLYMYVSVTVLLSICVLWYSMWLCL